MGAAAARSPPGSRSPARASARWARCSAALAREARTASLVALLVVLPIVFLGLVPREVVPAAAWISDAFPFAHAVRFFAGGALRLEPVATVAARRRSGSSALGPRYGDARAARRRRRLMAGVALVGVSAFPVTRLRRLRRTDRSARPRPRDAARPGRLRHAAVRRRRTRTPNASCPRMGRFSVDDLVREAERARAARRPRRAALRDPRGEGRARARARGTTTAIVQRALRALAAAHPGAAAAHRRLPVRVHRPRPLRRAPRTARSRTTRRSSCSRAPRSATSRPAPTSSRRAT